MQFSPQLLLILTLLPSCFGDSRPAYNETGDDGSKFAYTIVVDKSGKGNFSTVQAAIDSIPLNNDRWIKIHINPGVYIEQVKIPYGKPFIFLEGQDRSVTTITYNASLRTDLSATFSSLPDNIVFKGITFKNSYNLAPILAKYGIKEDVLGIKQAVALRVLGDKCAFYDCGFMGLQDTLWDAEGRHYFSNCYIEGAVDFIFGRGRSFYEDCLINATVGSLPPEIFAGFITAQGRKAIIDKSGFVFERGSIFGTRQVFLGRAYGPYSRVIFHQTTMSDIVAPEGWYSWSYPEHENDITYAEVDCQGPGSDTAKRVPWEKKLSPSQLSKFSRSSFIDQGGWIAQLPLN